MTRFFSVLAVVAIALLAFGVMPAVGQDGGNDTTATGEAVENISVDLGEAGSIERWEFRDGTWSLHLRTTLPLRVTVTDSGALFGALSEGDGARAVSIPAQTYTVDRGRSVLRFPAETHDGQAAVTVATNHGVVLLRTGSMQTTRPPVPWRMVQLLVGFAVVGTALGTWRYVARKQEQKDEGAERII